MVKMRLVEAGFDLGGIRRWGKGVLTEIKRFVGPPGYIGIADYFLQVADEEWFVRNHSSEPNDRRPFKINFDPWRFNIVGKPQDETRLAVTRGLFEALKEIIPPISDKAFLYSIAEGNISYYLGKRNGALQEVGILRQGKSAQVVLFPPEYNHSLGHVKKEGVFPKQIEVVSEIRLDDIDRDLPQDPSPQRRFRLVIEEPAQWESVAV